MSSDSDAATVGKDGTAAGGAGAGRGAGGGSGAITTVGSIVSAGATGAVAATSGSSGWATAAIDLSGRPAGRGRAGAAGLASIGPSAKASCWICPMTVQVVMDDLERI